jgi:hypothetical protein
MKKYIVTATFEWEESLMALIPEHRAVIDALIKAGSIESYAVSMEVQTTWITMNAENKADVHRMLRRSPLHAHWTSIEVSELMIWDGLTFRLPALVMN